MGHRQRREQPEAARVLRDHRSCLLVPGPGAGAVQRAGGGQQLHRDAASVHKTQRPLQAPAGAPLALDQLADLRCEA